MLFIFQCVYAKLVDSVTISYIIHSFADSAVLVFYKEFQCLKVVSRTK